MAEDNRNEIVIKRLRRALSEYVSDEVLASLRIDEYDVFDRIGRNITALIDLPAEPLKTIKGETTYEFPKNWFNHFRLNCFPRLLIKRFPIKCKIINVPFEVEVGVVYPKLKIAFPEHTNNMRFYTLPKISSYSMREE
jgi:hypothetical protein